MKAEKKIEDYKFDYRQFESGLIAIENNDCKKLQEIIKTVDRGLYRNGYHRYYFFERGKLLQTDEIKEIGPNYLVLASDISTEKLPDFTEVNMKEYCIADKKQISEEISKTGDCEDNSDNIPACKVIEGGGIVGFVGLQCSVTDSLKSDKSHESFKKAANKMIKWLNKYGNPHDKVIIEIDRAEHLQGNRCYITNKHIKN